jgi:peptide-methionine (S)-S-oxide reductase
MKTAKATFAAGCFWGVEADFRMVEGVTATRVGYIGGHTDNPTYRQVCSHSTGHAEAVEVTYDPDRVGYDELLRVFWKGHDPTQVDRQGPDIGDQYRSAIFVHDDAQREAAEASQRALEREGRLRGPIATQIIPAGTFWEAEDHHQQYLEKRGQASCRIG